MTELGIELDAQFAAMIGDAAGQAAAGAVGDILKHGRHEPGYPPGTVQCDSKQVVLTTGAPVLGNSVGPLVGWAWRVNRISIVGATAGTYAVYRDKGLGLQDQLLPPAGATWTPNGTYEPARLVLRYPYAMNAVGTGVTTAGLLIIDYFNIREDWLADAVT